MKHAIGHKKWHNKWYGDQGDEKNTIRQIQYDKCKVMNMIKNILTHAKWHIQRHTSNVKNAVWYILNDIFNMTNAQCYLQYDKSN